MNPVARNQNLNTLDTAEGGETGVGGGAGALTEAGVEEGAEEMMIRREAGVEEEAVAAEEGEEEAEEEEVAEEGEEEIIRRGEEIEIDDFEDLYFPVSIYLHMKNLQSSSILQK